MVEYQNLLDRANLLYLFLILLVKIIYIPLKQILP